MAKLLKLRRGSTSQHSSFAGAEGEVTVDTDKDTLVVHDGSTNGGFPVLRASGGAQNISTTGTISSNNITISDTNPKIEFTDSDHNPDFSLQVNSGAFAIHDETNSTNRLQVNSDGHVDVNGNLDVGAGIDVTGSIEATGNVDIVGQLQVGSVDTFLKQNQLRSNAPGSMFFDHGTTGQDIVFRTSSSSALDTNSLTIKSNGNVDIASGVDVTGNITVTGTVDGVDVAGLDSTVGALGLTGNTLANGVHGTTQSQGDNSTKIATTAYTDTAVANLVDSAPGALNTLNELAAALGDDANFSTTVTNSIAAKLPLAGGTMSGNLTIGGSNVVFGDSSSGGTNLNRLKFGAGDDLHIYHDSAGNNFVRSTNNHDLILRGGTGDAYVQGSDCFLGNSGGTKKYLDAHEDGAVELYHNNQKKAETVSGGFTVSGTCTATAFAGDGSALTGIVSFVSGMIIMYNSATAPSGWYLCDGNNGTPDLRDRFIVGAGNSYSLNATGGSNTATDTVSISGSDTVNISISGTCSLSGSGNINSGFNNGKSTISFSGSGSDTVNISGSDTVSVDTRSPYYALTFIMKA